MQAFLHRVINGSGRINREYGLGVNAQILPLSGRLIRNRAITVKCSGL